MNSYENEQMLTTTVHIPIQKITTSRNIDGLITYHLKNLFEGMCGKEGYVIKNSIFVVQRSIGKIVTIDSKSNVQYDVTYKLRTIHPSKDDEYECLVEDSVIDGLIERCGIKDDEVVRLVSQLSDTIFGLYPTG